MDSILKSNYLCLKQKDRIIKSGYQAFYLLKTTFTEKGFQLKISGSTLNIYTVTVEDYRFICDCPDSNFCSKNNLYCKHVCFIIYFIGNINNINLFINKVLTPEEYNNIISRLKINCSDDPNIINSFLIKKYEEVNEIHIDNSKLEARNLDQDCPICFLSLKENDYVTCHKCLNAVHKNCNQKWLEYNTVCIFCRNNTWKEAKNVFMVDGYVNISK